MKTLFAVLLAAWSCAALAEAQPDALAWLERAAMAARHHNYMGTFVYQHGGQVETSRIIHMLDASGEYEKLEALDGPPREIIRNNEEVQCFFPGDKTVVIGKRRPANSFPAMLPAQLAALAESYYARKGGHERVAGFECQVIALDPKDGLRYGRKFCVDAQSGLLLKAKMLDEKNEAVEQFAFTQLVIGHPISKVAFRPRYSAKTPDWKLDHPVAPATEDAGWVVKDNPAGFRKVMEMRRAIHGKPEQVTHIVYSDGLAAVSVFIEPLAAGGKAEPVLSRQGAINIYIRPYEQHLVTVLGETPAATVMQIANSIYKGK